jgi:diadenylate cyclase
MNYVYSALGYIMSILATFAPTDVIDILLVAFLIYKGFQLVRETRAKQLVKGILLLIIAYYVSELIGLKSMSFILLSVMQFGVIALVVIFQPELRSALERLGSTRVERARFFGGDSDTQAQKDTRDMISEVLKAVQVLHEDRVGALILFERLVKLGDVINTGTLIDAKISDELICNIFYPKSPLHDGAMVIRGLRLHAAGCFLPLSQNQEISRELGTRHRAALGISENSDVLVIVVSEETGVISLVEHGVIKRNMNTDTLRIALEKALIPKKPDEGRKSVFRVFKK